jgi:hypothetical protein
MVCAVPPAAASYTEAHQIGDDVRIRVDPSGHAHVEHTLSWRIVAGQKRTFDLVGVEPSAQLEGAATATDEEERDSPVQVVFRPGAVVPTLVATVDDPKGLRRGKYRLRIAYDVDLVAEHELARDGSMWRLAWSAPVAPEGYDGARVVLDVPGAATEPRAVRPDSDARDESILSNLRRDVERDVLELARPHVARGDAAVWSVLLSPRALSGLHMDSSGPLPGAESALRRPVDRSRLLGEALGLIALAGLYGWVVRAKQRAFQEACRRAGTEPRAAVPLPLPVRAFVAGVAVAAGVALQMSGTLELGSLLIAAAMACATVSVAPALSLQRARARGPGQWLAVRPAEAFGSRSRQAGDLDALDVGTRSGLAVLVLACGAALGLAFQARRTGLISPYLVALDALALVPIFATGRRVELPPTVASVARTLRPLFVRLARNVALRVAPWARVPKGAHEPDELRLLVMPKLALPGLIGIEVGIASERTSRQYACVPEVLVRVHEASAAQARMTSLVPRTMPLTGRRPEERVYRVAPRFPTSGWTRALVERLARELFDKRRVVAGWAGEERRTPAQTNSAATSSAPKSDWRGSRPLTAQPPPPAPRAPEPG